MSKAKEEDILDTGRLGDIRKRLSQNLPGEWQLTTLGEAFKWGSGGTPKRTDKRFYGGDIPWLIIGDLNEGVVTDSATTITEKGLKESSAKWVEPGSILLAMYGSIGKLGIAGRRLTTNQAIAFTKPDPVDAKYLFYYLMHTRGDLASLGKGATQKNISQTVIKAFPFVLAPQDQQKNIVAEIEKQFTRLDEAVANLKRVKANLKRYKAAVLKAAVEGRLVETEAELARKRTPSPLAGEGGGEGASYETGAQLLQRILETRRSRWLACADKAGRKGKGKYKEPTAPDTTDLPELPEGWVWAAVDQLLMSLRNGLSRKPEDSAPGVPILRISAVRPLELDAMDRRFYRPLSSEHVEDYELAVGDVLFVRYNGTKELVGVCALVRAVSGALLYPDKLIRGRVVSEQQVLPSYLAIAANVGKSRQHIDELIKTTAGQQGIAGGEIKQMPLPLPPYAEQLRIVVELDRRLSLTREIEVQVDANLKRADRLRQSILSNEFAGK